MQKATKLLIGCVALMLALGFAFIGNMAWKADNNSDILRSSVLERQIRVVSWHVSGDVLRSIYNADSERHIDWLFNSPNVFDADVFILFVNRWEDVFEYEHAEALNITRGRLEQLRDENPEFDTAVFLDILENVSPTGHAIQVQIYNTANMGEPSKACLTGFLLAQIAVQTPYQSGNKLLNCQE